MDIQWNRGFYCGASTRKPQNFSVLFPVNGNWPGERFVLDSIHRHEPFPLRQKPQKTAPDAVFPAIHAGRAACLFCPDCPNWAPPGTPLLPNSTASALTVGASG